MAIMHDKLHFSLSVCKSSWNLHNIIRGIRVVLQKAFGGYCDPFFPISKWRLRSGRAAGLISSLYHKYASQAERHTCTPRKQMGVRGERDSVHAYRMRWSISKLQLVSCFVARIYVSFVCRAFLPIICAVILTQITLMFCFQ